MILFQDDWLKYKNASIHYETRNESFLKLAEVYYKMGIKNNAFHLSLLQPELRNINPTLPNLPMDICAKIIYECKNNPWYVFREIIRVPVPGSLTPTMFAASRANIAMYWLFYNHITTISVILRQTGKTTSLVSLVASLLNFQTTNTFINLLTKNETLKAETMVKAKQIIEELPDYLNFSNKKDIFNNDEIRFKEFNNVFKGNLSSSSPKQAEKVGRGFTSPINLIDEAAFIENVAVAMGAMLMSGNNARELARTNGKPYGTILTTTAGNLDDRDGGYIYNISEAATVWSESFYDTNDHRNLVETILKNSNSKNSIKTPIVNITMSYRQLGLSEDWLQRRLEENISTPENIARDIFNQWLSGSNESPIDIKYLNLIKENVIEEPITEIYSPHNYILNWYITEEDLESRILNEHNFIAGIDTSDGVGKDDIAFVVRDHVSGQVICTAVFNELNLITLADFFVSFLVKYTNCTFIIERRSSAAAIIDYIIQKLVAYEINPFTRLYNTVYQNKEQYPREYEELSKAKYYNEDIFTKYKKHIGFSTSGAGITSRSELYSSTLISMLKYTGYCLYDKKLISQICSLVIKNNRIDHRTGSSDDLVIASLLSYWLMINGKNLDMYGIDSTKMLKFNEVYLEEKQSMSDVESTEELTELENRLNSLIEEYSKETNDIISRQIEVKIKKLGFDLNNFNYNLSVEEMLQSIKRDKKLSRKL